MQFVMKKQWGPVALSANYSFVSGDNEDGDNFALSADYAVDNFTIGAAYFEGFYDSNDVTSMGCFSFCRDRCALCRGNLH